MDFAIGLVNSVFFFWPDEQVKFLTEFKIYRTVVNPAYQKHFLGVVKMTVGLAHASYS